MTSFFKILSLFSILFLAAAPAMAQDAATLPERQVTVPTINGVPSTSAPATAGEMAQRQALVAKYLTPQRYGSLYEMVVEQYSSMTPNNNNVQSLKDDPAFRDQVFAKVQQRASKTFTLDELQAMARFVDSPEGKSINSKVNALGLQFRQKDLNDQERAALQSFSQSPQGKSIAGKGVVFASQTLGDVMRAVLIRQAMSSGM